MAKLKSLKSIRKHKRNLEEAVFFALALVVSAPLLAVVAWGVLIGAH